MDKDKALSAADSLSPEKSVERLEELAKLILGNIVLVAGTLMALGVFTDLGESFGSVPFIAAAVFVVVSILLAFLTLAPLDAAPVYRSEDEGALRKSFRRKVIFILLAVLFLIFALVAAVFPEGADTVGLEPGPPDPQVTVSLSRSAANDTSRGAEVAIVGAVKVVGVLPGTLIDASVTGRDASGADVVFFRASAVADAGDVDLPIRLDTVDPSLDWILAVSVIPGGAIQFEAIPGEAIQFEDIQFEVIPGEAIQGEAIIHREIELKGVQVDVQDSVHLWGDVDCSGGEVDPTDSLKILRHDAGKSVGQEAGCPEIGVDVTLVE